MSDNHITVIDMYAKSQDESGKMPYKAYEGDLTKDRQLLMRVYHGEEEGESLIPYSLIVKVKHRPLVRMLIDQQLPDALSQGDAEYTELREHLRQNALRQIRALETEIAPLSLLEQVASIRERLGMSEQLLIFDTNAILILEGRHLDTLIEPLQDAEIRKLHCFGEAYDAPRQGEPIITEVTEYELNTYPTSETDEANA